MVQSDIGITFIPELAIRANLLKYTAIETMDMPAHAYREIGFAWRKGTRQREKFCQFAKTLLTITGINLPPVSA